MSSDPRIPQHLRGNLARIHVHVPLVPLALLPADLDRLHPLVLENGLDRRVLRRVRLEHLAQERARRGVSSGVQIDRWNEGGESDEGRNEGKVKEESRKGGLTGTRGG